MQWDLIINVVGEKNLKSIKNQFSKSASDANKYVKTLNNGIDSIAKNYGDIIKKSGIVAGAGLAAFSALATSAGSTYQSMQKAAYASTGSQEKANEAVERLSENLKQSGIDANQAARKMNAFLAGGMSAKLAADLGQAMEYMEAISDEAGPMTGAFQDLQGGLPITVGYIEDIARGMKISQGEVLKMAGYIGKVPETFAETDAAVAALNQRLGSGKKLVANLAMSKEMQRNIEASKTYGTFLERLTAIFNKLFSTIGKNSSFDKLLDNFSKLTQNEAFIAKLQTAFNTVFTAITNFVASGSLQRIIELVGMIIENWEIMLNVMGLIATIIVALKGFAILMQIVTMIKAVTAALALLNLGFIQMAIKATLAWIAALGPIAWFIAAIVGLAALITWAIVDKWDEFKAAIYKAFRWVIDTAIPWLWNAFKILGEVLLAVFFPIPYLVIKFWDEIVAAFFSAIDWIKNIFSEFTSWVVSIGANIIDGIINGMTSAASKLYESIKSIATQALDIFKDIFDINSPSKEMAKIGRYNVQGLQKGQESQVESLAKSNNKIAGVTLGSFAGAATTNNNNASVVININGGNTSEVKSAIIEVFQELNFQLIGA